MEEFIPQLKTDKEFTNKIIRKYHFGGENTGKVQAYVIYPCPWFPRPVIMYGKRQTPKSHMMNTLYVL